jgi:hypothetical protein
MRRRVEAEPSGRGFLFINHKTGVGASWGRFLLSDSSLLRSKLFRSGLEASTGLGSCWCPVQAPNKSSVAIDSASSRLSGIPPPPYFPPQPTIIWATSDALSLSWFARCSTWKSTWNYRSSQCEALLEPKLAQNSATDYLSRGKCIALPDPFTRSGG